MVIIVFYFLFVLMQKDQGLIFFVALRNFSVLKIPKMKRISLHGFGASFISLRNLLHLKNRRK